ncbi:protein peste [Drosophila eugracilis]|uniref:protein peste n=1 Tax=Drosophila eugracilis TaxID=29029 RepID=UPI001BDB4A2E|nr:protein peste [Drosophila eugracilis]
MTSGVRHCARLGIVVLGILCIFSGIYLLLNWIDMFTRMRGKEMALSPTSRSFEGWKVSPLPLNFDVYLFNWTNPQDFYVGSGKKPHFQQLGPYRFRELPDKVDIDWHNQNASVSFHKKSWFHFDAAGSNGSLSDMVTQVNTVAHAAAKRAGATDSWFAKVGINFANTANSQELTVTHTVEEMLFKGYDHPFITLGKFIRPQDVPYKRVGFQYPRNGSADFDGYINMYTGADDITKMGQIHTWNDLNHTGAFEGACGQVHGSMGEFFPPNLSTNDTVYMYMPKMCRAIPLDYTETVTVHGVTAYRFSGTQHAVDNGTLHPDTKCYCVGGKCMPIGVINIGPCAFNASVYMSFPHFYMADPSYLEAIEGLQPEREKHEFFMTLEPNAGVPMDVGGGFQANYYMEPVRGISLYDKVPTMMIPMMWCEERVRVSEEIASDIALVPLIVLLGQIVTGILLAGGLICTCWYPTRQVTHFCHSDPKAKASVLRPLTSFGVNSKAPTAPTLFRNNTSSSGNERVGVRLLDYNRDSGLRREVGITESSARERLIGEDSPDVIVR